MVDVVDISTNPDTRAIYTPRLRQVLAVLHCPSLDTVDAGAKPGAEVSPRLASDDE